MDNNLHNMVMNLVANEPEKAKACLSKYFNNVTSSMINQSNTPAPPVETQEEPK
jgi:hypothetical protein